MTSATLFSLNLINLSYALLPWAVPFVLYRHRRIKPVYDVAFLHLAHEKEDILPHLDMLAEGQIRHEQPPAGALGPLDGKALRRGMLPQLVGRLLQAGEVQRFLQLRQLGRAVDVDKIVLVLEPVDTNGMCLLLSIRSIAL